MSTAAIKQVVSELEALSESDQELVLGFLRALRDRHARVDSERKRHGRNPAMTAIDGLLVFTGELNDPHTDWVKVVREEREEALVRQNPEQGQSR